MQPLIKAVLPSSPVVYVIMFAVLSPLALYRGPLNMYGLGSGLANILLAAGTMSPAAVGMALRSTSIVQCISDPTNTQNVITADYAKVDVNEILKSTLPYTMVIALITLIYTAIFIY
jgi:predicted cation transporter